jgi:hypothetical protein
MTDTLEIRPIAQHPMGNQAWGVLDVAKGKFVASYSDRESAYAWAFGYLNERVRNLNSDVERLTEANNALNKSMSR